MVRNCGSDFSGMLYHCIYEDSLYTGTQYAYITSYYSILLEIQQKVRAFKSCFLVIRAVVVCQNKTKQLLSSSTNLLTPLFNFFETSNDHRKLTEKHEVPPHRDPRKANDHFLTSKIKTFTMAH